MLRYVLTSDKHLCSMYMSTFSEELLILPLSSFECYYVQIVHYSN